jgi:hypothetical protein
VKNEGLVPAIDAAAREWAAARQGGRTKGLSAYYQCDMIHG